MKQSITMKKITILLLSLWGFQSTFAQQDAIFTHYMYNTLGVNAAYAGSRDVITGTLLHRTQWTSLEGAPETQTFNIHSPLGDQNIGLGLSIINEKIGPSKSTVFYGDFSYRLMLTEQSRIAFGLNAGVNVFKTSFNDLDVGEVYDETFEQDITSGLIPNFGFGIYYDTPNYYVGFSSPHLLKNKLVGIEAAEALHYYLIAGYMMDITKKLQFKPTTLIKATAGAPLEMDFTALFVLNNRFNLGAMYRSQDALGVLLGMDISKVLSLGYSFDWSSSGYWNKTKATIQRTSHELMLRYEFDFKDKVRSPRYF